MEQHESDDLLSIVMLFHEERKKAYAREHSEDVRAAIAVEMSDLEYIAVTIRGHKDGSWGNDAPDGDV